MHLSISNSNSRIPNAPYKQIWFLGLLLLVVALFLNEQRWRNKGFLPNITDTKLYWGLQRDNVYSDNGKKKIVIIGFSRSQLGIVPEVLEAQFNNYKVVHLAIDGANAFAVLKDLSEDFDFNGIVLFDTFSPSLLNYKELGAKPWIDFYRNNFKNYGVIEKKLNLLINTWLQTNIVSLSSQLSLRNILQSKFTPKLSFLHMDQNRYKQAYYYDRMTATDLKRRREKRIEGAKKNFRPASVHDEIIFKKVVNNELLSFYKRLKFRGGDLILIRMPTTDEPWQHSQMKYPKKKFWDQITNWSHIPTIHFKDYKELSSFDCPDTSHLDANDAPEFTKRLANIIEEKLGI